MAKRFFDLVLSGFGLILLSPLFLAVAIWIKLDSRGPVFFKGKRVGRGGSDFRIIKFRSMFPDASQKGPELTAGDDQRITRAGRLLRKTKMDELPQLVNVFRGEMSLVGPRPEVRRYVDLFRDDYEEILAIRPGVTDLASLEFRNEAELLGQTEDPESYYIDEILPEKIRLAKEYRRRSSVRYDLTLIGRTMAALTGQQAFLEIFTMATLILIMTVAVIYPDSFISGGPTVDSFRLSPITILTPLVLLAGLVLIVRGSQTLRIGTADLAIFGFMGYFLLRNLAGEAFPGALKYALYSLVVFYLCSTLIRKPSFLKTIIYAIVTLTLVSALYGIFIEYIIQRNVIFHSLIIDSVKESPRGLHRIGSSLGHPVAYGAFLIQAIPFCVYLGASRESNRDRVFGIAASVLAVTALLFTFSKGSWLTAAIIALAALLLLAFRKRWKELLLLSGLAAFLAVISLFFWSTISTEFSTRLYSSVWSRSLGWTAAVDAIKDQPLFGAGFHEAPGESYVRLEETIKDRYEVYPVDNSYLALLLEEGAIGVVLWMVFLALTTVSGIRAILENSAGNRAIAVAALVSFIGFCLNAVTFEAFFIWSNLIFFWVSAGMVHGAGKPVETALFANTNDHA